MSLQSPAMSGVTKITASELKDKIESEQAVTVVDVRTTSEYRSGHVARSINVPMDEIDSRLDDIPPGPQVVLVCQGGTRAQMTRDLLGDRIGRVVCLEGGLDSWVSADLPVVRATRTKIALDRQAMIGASVIILTSVALGTFVHPSWFYLALIPGIGLMLAGAAGLCLMGIILSTMPWNKSRSH